ncbi:hypothetical protein BRADI_3g27555v3 [Brachypodium distachyon]|uniref:Endonuclease/exonuclease/phosphatase domain-containing protein n=1 Tax=Brachypodium distachyon TaxID=15368 RepID=A0A2K2CZJ9_BRADI|nr:hypothetical protein BRADI_3g27555v3 [Brachypodium distachyon]
MEIVSWNCRGLGNRPAVRRLLELQKSENPDMVFLSETRLVKSKLERIRWMLGLPNLLARDCDETGGRVGVKRERWKGVSGNFKFEARWLAENDCRGIVEEAWEDAAVMSGSSVLTTLRKVARDLRSWDRDVLGDLEKRLNKAKADLEKCRRRNLNAYNVSQEALLRRKVDKLEEETDTFLETDISH